MASRHLRTGRDLGRPTTRTSTARCSAEAGAPGHPALARRRRSTRSCAGYFGSADVPTAIDTVLRIIREHADKVDGASRCACSTRATRSRCGPRLPEGVRALHRRRLQLPRSSSRATASSTPTPCSAPSRRSPRPPPPRSRRSTPATRTRTGGSSDPTEALARHVFAAPTFYYKTGVAFLSWLNGHQPAFSMVGGLHAARSLPHLSDAVAPGRRGGRCSNDPAWPPSAGTPAGRCTASRHRRRMSGRDRSTRGCRSTRRRSSTPTSPTALTGDPRGGHRARSGCGGNRSPRSASRRRPTMVGRLRPAGLQPVPRRLLHRRRPAAAAGRAGRQPRAPSRRPPRWPRRAHRLRARAGPGRRRAAGRATATCPAPGRGPPTPSPTWSPTPPTAGVVLALEPLHPMYAADRGGDLHARPGARPRRAVPGRDRRRRRRHLPRLVGPAAGRADRAGRPRRPDRRLPGVRLDHAARRGRAARPRHDGRRPHRLRRHHPAGHAMPGTPATSRWRSSTRRSGTPTLPRPLVAPSARSTPGWRPLFPRSSRAGC